MTLDGTEGKQQVIGTLSGKRLLRWLLVPLILALVVSLLGVATAYLASQSPNASPEQKRAMSEFLARLGLVAGVLCVGLSAVEVLGQHTVILRDGYLALGGRRIAFQRVALDNIVEVRIRREGSVLMMGLGRGSVGVVLRRPEVRAMFGNLDRLGPRLWKQLCGAHVVLFPLYRQSPEELAGAIAAAVEVVRGVRMAACAETKHVEFPPVARPTRGPSGGPGESLTLEPAPALLGQIQCVMCGYDVRAQAIDSRCPECGTPVVRSFEGGLLATADRQWVVGLRRSSVMIAGSSILVALSGLDCLINLATLNPSVAGTRFPILSFYGFLAVYAALLIGSVWFAAHPTALHRPVGEAHARWCALAGLLPAGVGRTGHSKPHGTSRVRQDNRLW